MAFRTQKISQMTPKGANLEATDLIEVSTIESGSYVTRSITGQELIDAIPAPSVDWGDIGGTLSAQTDLQSALDAKVPTSRTLTINGVTQDLSADRTFTISTGITIGSTAITSGTVGRVLFQGTGNVVQQSSSLFWDATNNRLGIGTSAPAYVLDVNADNAYFGLNRNSGGSGPALFFFRLAGAGGANVGIAGSANDQLPSSVANDLFLRTNGFSILFGNSSTTWGKFFTTGNLGINTTTDAGFRLDVNGTARVSGQTTMSTNVVGNFLSLLVSNTNSGNTSRSTISLQNDAGDVGSIGAFSSTFVGSGDDAASALRILAPASGGLALRASNAAGNIRLYTQSTERMRIAATTGNVLINTTTDAGFRLDVNGTARVSTSLATPIWAWSGTNVSQRIQTTQVGSVNRALINIENGQGGLNYSTDGFVNSILAINNSLILQNQGMASCFTINPTYNFNANVTSGAIMRGIYYNPTLTNIGTAQHFAFHSTSGRVRFENLPTSSAGLSAGELWNDAGTLKIV